VKPGERSSDRSSTITKSLTASDSSMATAGGGSG
jgi:hypothetical protein